MAAGIIIHQYTPVYTFVFFVPNRNGTGTIGHSKFVGISLQQRTSSTKPMTQSPSKNRKPEETDSKLPGRQRRPPVERDEILQAALSLVGPDRSVSTLSLREVARAANIAPNSFYRQFRDINELAVALIEEAGSSLRTIIRQARERRTIQKSIIVISVETFMEKLDADDQLLQLLLREGNAGSSEYRQAVDTQLQFFEDELREDLVTITEAANRPVKEAFSLARGITRIVFALGAMALDRNAEDRQQIAQQMTAIVRMMIAGAQTSNP